MRPLERQPPLPLPGSRAPRSPGSPVASSPVSLRGSVVSPLRVIGTEAPRLDPPHSKSRAAEPRSAPPRLSERCSPRRPRPPAGARCPTAASWRRCCAAWCAFIPPTRASWSALVSSASRTSLSSSAAGSTRSGGLGTTPTDSAGASAAATTGAPCAAAPEAFAAGKAGWRLAETVRAVAVPVILNGAAPWS
jgi:hypothetical protein